MHSVGLKLQENTDPDSLGVVFFLMVWEQLAHGPNS